jgi:predicted FMN-binding regulatory protein PaiB
MCRAIVGFDLRITELQAKWKFDQKKGADDRAGAISALEALEGESNLAVATTMHALDR